MSKDALDDWKLAVLSLSIALFFFVVLAVGFGSQVDNLKAELYCGDSSFDWTPVYDENSNAAVKYPIGYRCCETVKGQYLDTGVGVWKKYKFDKCFYQVKEEKK